MIGGVVGGTGGSGTLNITGGLVGDTSFIQTSLTTASRIGAGVGSAGLLTLTDGTLGAAAIYIGDVGTGTMTVNSGYAKLSQAFIGYSSGAQGTVNLLGGTVANGSNFQVGGTGTGTLTINGSLVQARQTEIGNGAGSSGSVTVTSGTLLNNGAGTGNQLDGYVKIGVSGTGSLTINNGGYVVASGTVVRGAHGTLTLNQGGTLQIGSNDGSNNPFTLASGTAGALVGDLNYAGTLKFAQIVDYTYSDKLSGAGNLVKTGTGTLNLTGSNSYTGGTTIEQGRIALATANAIGATGTISFSTSGTIDPGALQFSANNTTDYSSRFSTAANQRYAVDSNGQSVTLASNLTSSGGSFTKYGSGTVSLTGANTFTSGSVAAGSLVGTASNLATTGTFSVNTGGEVRFDQATSGTWAGAMAGSGTFTKVGAGALTLTGSTSNTNGALVVSDGSVIGDSKSIRRAVSNNSQVTFDQAVSGTYSSVLSGTGTFVKDGVGTLVLTGNNISYTGPLTLADGTLSAGSANALGTSGTISFEGGTLQSTASNTTDYSARFSPAASQLYRFDTNGQNVTLASNLTSSGGSFTKLGTGTVTLSGSNSYSGGTTVSAGSLIGTTTSLQGAITNNAAVTFDQATNGSYAGAMSGSGSLTKLGNGAVTLAGTSSYGGATTVSAGALVINGTLTNSAVTVGSGATLGGSGTIGSSVTVQSGGTIAPGNSPGLITVGSLNLLAGSTTLMQIVGVGSAAGTAGTAGTDYDKIAVTTASSLGYGGGLSLDFANTSTFSDGTLFDLFGFTGSTTGDFSSVASTGTGSYAGLTFTGVGGVWTAILGSQTITFSQLSGLLRFDSNSAPVPEIDPSTFGSALAFVIGSLGLLERRARRRSRG